MPKFAAVLASDFDAMLTRGLEFVRGREFDIDCYWPVQWRTVG